MRIVSATHKDLAAEVQAQRFRQDLYYRLNVIRIVVPPLRERIDDLPALCAAAMRRIAAEAGVVPVPSIAPDALAWLQQQPFAGNVRELENLLHRALALAGSDVIGRTDLAPPDAGAGAGLRADRPAVATADPPGGAEAAAAAGSTAPAVEPALPSDLVAHLDAVEREILERALQRHRFNRTAAGASLGLSLRQMRYRMARLGVGSNDNEHGDAD